MIYEWYEAVARPLDGSHPLAGQRVALTPGRVGVMTDGRAVMLGARGKASGLHGGPVL